MSGIFETPSKPGAGRVHKYMCRRTFRPSCSTRIKKVGRLAGCAAADSRRVIACNFFWRNETLETQNPPREAGRCPGKTGEFECLNNIDTPRKSDPMQALVGNGFVLPEISPFRAGCPQPERRTHVYFQRLAEPTGAVFRDGIGGLRRAALPCPRQIRPTFGNLE